MKLNPLELIISRVVLLLKIDHTAVSFTLCLLATLLAFGFIIVGVPTNIPTLTIVSSTWLWPLLFLIYALMKFVQCLGRTHPVLRILFSVSGLWLWTYTALSFLIIDKFLVTPVEFLLFLPLLCELGYLSSLIYLIKIRGKGRRPDDY